MPRVKIDYVISFSSEDAENPANSLLRSEVSRRKWLGEKGESSHSVVLQFAKSTRIQSVTIGSYHSALIEVLVGRSEKPLDPFKVLVLSSVFMTPSESKKDEPVSKVRTFHYEQLAPETRDENWDRVRVVCHQPYNKHVKYGLSFIHIFEPEVLTTKNEWTPSQPSEAQSFNTTLHRFKIEDNTSDGEDSFRPGELFAKMRTSLQLSVDAQIRKASKPSSLQNPNETSAKLSRVQLNVIKPKSDALHIADERISRDRDNILYKDEEKPNDKIDKIIKRDREEKERHKEIEMSLVKHEDNDRLIKNGEQTNYHKDSSQDNKKRKDTFKHRTEDDLSRNNHVNSNQREPTPVKPQEKFEKDSTNDKQKQSSNSDTKKDRNKNGESSSSKQSRKRPHSKDKTTERPSKKLRPGPRSTSPYRLMSDVVFVLSGYQNPRRAALKDIAFAMGAKYKQDWCDGCTHLICAFPNTPKLRQVRMTDDRAAVVKGEWFEECCKAMRLLPWQWFATEPDYRVEMEPYSDDEKEEPAIKSECDTDDEIQAVLDQQQKRDKHKTENTNKLANEKRLNSPHDSDVDFVCDERVKGKVEISDSETDEYTDEEMPPEKNDIKIDKSRILPDFFEGFTFTVDLDLQELGIDCSLLKRYIMAYSGEIVDYISDDTNVNYIISLNPVCTMKKKLKLASIVGPEWIWRCHKKQRKVSSKDFAVK